MQEIIEEIAYQSIQQNNPELLNTIRAFIARDYTPDQIIDLCIALTGQPRHRLAFIGCAADHLIRLRQQPPLISELEQ